MRGETKDAPEGGQEHVRTFLESLAEEGVDQEIAALLHALYSQGTVKRDDIVRELKALRKKAGDASGESCQDRSD